MVITTVIGRGGLATKYHGRIRLNDVAFPLDPSAPLIHLFFSARDTTTSPSTLRFFDDPVSYFDFRHAAPDAEQHPQAFEDWMALRKAFDDDHADFYAQRSEILADPAGYIARFSRSTLSSAE